MRRSHFWPGVLLAIVMAWVFDGFATPHTTSPAAAGDTTDGQQNEETAHEAHKAREREAKELYLRERQGNGIFISTPEVYDDSSLQSMLNTARAKLAALQGFNQATLTGHLGAITGSTLQQSAFSAQIANGPLPQTVTTANGPISSVAATTGATPSTTTTTTAPDQSVATTGPQSSSPIPAPPTDTAYTLPSTFSGSASDVLNEEVQLTFEIANLELLLEGSLSDRFVAGQRLIKRRTTVGFPVNLDPDDRYKNAVAVVEVSVESPKANTYSNEPPAVTALLPREKTYNVAALTDHMTSIGAGIVTQVVSAGATWVGGRKTFYVVQDQDTLALSQASSDPSSQTSFLWQFRPVLGRSFVSSGLRQTFVQLAVPISSVAGCFGKVSVRTYWRKFDQKNAVVGNVIADSIRTQQVWPIPVYDLAPFVQRLAYEDLGGGQIQVGIGGSFLGGTYIRVGNVFYREGTAGFTSDSTGIRFVASAADIAQHSAYIVSRDGTEVELLNPQDAAPRPKLGLTCDLKPDAQKAEKEGRPSPGDLAVRVTSFDGGNVVLEATASNLPDDAPRRDSYLLVVGNRVFGLSDSTFERTAPSGGHSISYRVVVPVSLLIGSKDVSVRPLFRERKDFEVKTQAKDFSFASTTDHLVLLEKNDKGAKFILLGNRLKDAKILYPPAVSLGAAASGDQDTLRLLDLTADQLKTSKAIVLEKDGERPVIVSIPAPDAKESAAKPTLVLKNRVTVGMDQATVTGDGLEKLKAVRFGKKVIKFSLADDKKSVVLSGLVAAGVTATPTGQEVDFEFESGDKASVVIDVVNSRIETVERPKN